MAVSCVRRDAPPVIGTTRDIGIGGAFIESAELPAFGAEVVVVGRLPGTQTELRLPGVVRWASSDGFGVQFGLLGARETHALSALLQFALGIRSPY